MIKGNIIKACEDGAVIEAVFNTKMYMTPCYSDVAVGVIQAPTMVAKEYVLQTFFGNDIEIKVDSDGIIENFYLCNIKNVDWEEDEIELYNKYDKINRDIARLYADKIPVEVITDKNWRRD